MDARKESINLQNKQITNSKKYTPIEERMGQAILLSFVLCQTMSIIKQEMNHYAGCNLHMYRLEKFSLYYDD